MKCRCRFHPVDEIPTLFLAFRSMSGVAHSFQIWKEWSQNAPCSVKRSTRTCLFPSLCTSYEVDHLIDHTFL